MGSTARARPPRRACVRAASEGGFTLVELIVVMAILLIVVGSLASVLVSATKAQVDANARFQAQVQARAGLDQLRHELHCASAVTQTDSTGTALVAGTAYSAISLTLPSVCPTTGGTAMFATWCTSGSTLTAGDFALFRVTSTSTRPTCASAGTVKWADYLQTSTPFCLPAATATAACPVAKNSTASLPLLHVMMPVNLNGPTPGTKDTYNLVDDVALRNGTRS